MDFASVLCTIFEQLLPTKWRLPNNRNKSGVENSYTNNGENNLSKDAQIVTQNTPNTCNIYHKLKVKVNFKVSEVWMILLFHACCHNENQTTNDFLQYKVIQKTNGQAHKVVSSYNWLWLWHKEFVAFYIEFVLRP